MPVIFNCPACGQELAAPDDALGVAGQCRFCGAAIVAPSAPGQAATAAPAGAVGRESFEQTPPLVPPVVLNSLPDDDRPFIAPPTGRLDVGTVISETWECFRQHWGILALAFLLMFAIMCIPCGALSFWWGTRVQEAQPESFGQLLRAVWPAAAGIGVLLLVFLPLTVGIYYTVDEVVGTGTGSIGSIFRGYRRYFRLMGLLALQALVSLVLKMPSYAVQFPRKMEDLFNPPPISGISQALLSVTDIIVYGITLQFAFAVFEIVDRDVGPVSAMRNSWDLLEGCRLLFLALYVVLFIMAMLGLLGCCVGVFVSMSLLPLGLGVAYRHLRGVKGTPY